MVLFGEDVARRKGGVFKATQDLTERFGAKRCFNTPIAESSIIGAAIGMSAAGFKVIPEIQFADYIHPAFDQIVSEAARISFRSDGRWHVPIVIRTPYGAGIHGALYHSQSIESFYAHVPGSEGGGPIHPRRRQGSPVHRGRGPRPGDLPRAEEAVPAGQGPLSRRRAPGAPGSGGDPSSGVRTSPSSPTGRWPISPWRRSRSSRSWGSAPR